MKKLLIILILSILSSNLIYSQWSGSGTAEDPYLIKTLADLQSLNGFPLDENNHFLQVYDILDGLTQPINFFCGTYDGNGKIIELAINDSLDTMKMPALFSQIVGNTILKNITTTGYVKRSLTKINTWAAGLVYIITKYFNTVEFQHVQILNCINKANIISRECAGLIMRCDIYSSDTNMKLTVDRCINLGNIISYHSSTGIIFTFNGWWYSSFEQVTISNCVNYGRIVSQIDEKWHPSVVGIVSLVNGGYLPDGKYNISIKNCINTGVLEIMNFINGTTYEQSVRPITGWSGSGIELCCD